MPRDYPTNDIAYLQKREAEIDQQRAQYIAQQQADPKSRDYAGLRDLSLMAGSCAMQLKFLKWRP